MKKVPQAAQKKEIKKKIFFLFASIEQFLGFIFFIIVIALSSWSLFVVKNWIDDPERVVLSQLMLTGEQNFTKKEDIQQAIMGLGLPNTYIAQNVDDIQQEIMRLPWIKYASVRKQWPDRLIVHIVEYQPAFYWNEVFLLDNNGTVFSVPKERFSDDTLPKLFGPIGKEKIILKTYKKLKNMSNQLSDNNVSLMIRVAAADERNAWQLVVIPCIKDFCAKDQDIKLMLGRKKVDERYERFMRFYSDIQSGLPLDEQLIEADLRYDNGIAVKRLKVSL